MASVLGPGEGEGAHGSGLAGAGRGDRELQPSPGGAHLADQEGLPSIEGVPVRRDFEQGQIDRLLLDSHTVVTSGRVDETALGVEDSLRGVQVGAGDGVNRGAVDAPQHLRFLDAVMRHGQGNRPMIEHLIDQQVHERRGMLRGHVDGADPSLRFGPDMPHLPRRAARLHNGQDVISGLCDPV